MFLILDNVGGHHSKPVGAWLAEHQEKIAVCDLLRYSAELNPDERLNAELNHALGSRVALRTKAKLKLVTESHMKELEQRPETVPAYLSASKIKCAA